MNECIFISVKLYLQKASRQDFACGLEFINPDLCCVFFSLQSLKELMGFPVQFLWSDPGQTAVFVHRSVTPELFWNVCPDTFEFLSLPHWHFCIPLSDFCWFSLSQSPCLKQVLLLNFFGSLLFSVIAMLPSSHLFGLRNPGSRFLCFFFFAIIKKIVGENRELGKAWSLKDLLVIFSSLVANIRIRSRQFKQKWLYYRVLHNLASQVAQW